MKILPGTLWAAALLATPAWGDVAYRIHIDNPDHHSAQVQAQFPSRAAGTLEVKLPNWRTGRYQLLPLADGIRGFEALGSDGQPLAWQKTARATWAIALPKATEVTVRYQVHANELKDRSRHIDDTHAYLDASGVFMYSPQFRQEPVSVELEVPSGWRSVSGMDGDGAHRFVAPDYDVLVDSPIETGIHQDFAFEVDGRQYELVIWGEGNYDTELMVNDLKALVAAGGAYFGSDYPYERYVFMVHATTGVRGATEHLNSTVIQRPRWSFAKREDYLSFIATASHELVHTWNVKAYRPQGLVPYNYQSDNYTPLLWLAEGGTSYLQNLWLVRAGVMTVEEYLKDLAKRLVRHGQTPGRELQSVAEASFDNWIARGGDYGTNHSVSIYSEGFLANWALDFWLRDGDSGIEQLHRALYRDHRLPGAYNDDQLKRLVSTLGGRSAEPFWQSHIDGPLQLDSQALLAQAGLTLTLDEQRKLDLGLTTDGEGGAITRVRRDGPAWQAGLTAGDQLVAIDGQRWDPKAWEQTLARYQAGQSVTVTVFRRDRLMTRTLELAEQPKGPAKIQPLESVTGAQKARFEAWLGVDWPY
ncbi:M61 family metallopeptidase [Ferrimonas balearica]|uniref:M61 family metallopeptidase n=1 Tax=Ferrimonas balearica TaxID=44012 RepID=UPI001C99A4B3|nr:PDZ domain-containing protein [Ferrimonas balearica]MBY5992765.1 PDZ domain-containing protein [Ferrimonas balearica]